MDTQLKFLPIIFAALFLFVGHSHLSAKEISGVVQIHALSGDQSERMHPLGNTTVRFIRQGRVVSCGTSCSKGHVSVNRLTPGYYTIVAFSQEGFSIAYAFVSVAGDVKDFSVIVLAPMENYQSAAALLQFDSQTSQSQVAYQKVPFKGNMTHSMRLEHSGNLQFQVVQYESPPDLHVSPAEVLVAPGLNAYLLKAGEVVSYAQTDGTGNVSMENVSSGDYALLVTGPSTMMVTGIQVLESDPTTPAVFQQDDSHSPIVRIPGSLIPEGDFALAQKLFLAGPRPCCEQDVCCEAEGQDVCGECGECCGGGGGLGGGGLGGGGGGGGFGVGGLLGVAGLGAGIAALATSGGKDHVDRPIASPAHP